MKKSDTVYNLGDSVKVRPGITDPDDEAVNIGGWQGRIIDFPEAEDDSVFVEIEWDSQTLRAIPDTSFEYYEEKGLDWRNIVLNAEEIESADPRDSQNDVLLTRKTIEDTLRYSWMGEIGKRIQTILADVDPDDDIESFNTWKTYLTQHLSFPFDAIIDEYQEEGPLREGDQVKVNRISLIDEIYGIIVELRRGRERYDCPLCELDVLDKRSPNYQVVQDYRMWFVNQ